MDAKKLKDILSLLNSYTSSSKERDGESRKRVASDGSQPKPIIKEDGQSELPSDFSLDYYLTVRLRVTLSRRECSLLLGILNYQACHFGMNFGMYLSMEFLSSLLLGNKLHPSEIKEKYERDCCFSTLIILSSVADRNWNLLELSNRVPQRIIQGLTEGGLLITKRTYQSRFTTYRPEMLLEVRSVPVDNLIDRSKGNSQRYSSYTKGYGESHLSAHSQRTKPSFELDGDNSEKEYLNLKDISTLLVLTQLELWTKYYRKLREKA